MSRDADAAAPAAAGTTPATGPATQTTAAPLARPASTAALTQVSPGRGGTDPSAATTRRWLVAIFVIGYLLHVGWRLWLIRDLAVPAAHADEDRYLIVARALTGGAGGYSDENGAFRRTGYPLLLAPIYFFTSDPFQVYRGAQVFGIAVNALTFPLGFLFASRVLGAPRRWALGAAFVAAALPAVAFYSEFALTDSLMATLGLAWLLLVHAWLTATGRRHLLAAIGAGLVAGFVYAMHVRGTFLVLVHVLLTVVILLIRRTRLGPAAASVAAAGAAAAIDKVLKLVLGDAITIYGRSPKSDTVAALTTVDGFLRTVGGTIGQVWYLGVGTAGLGVAGLVVTIWPLLHRSELRRRMADQAEASRLLVGLAALGASLLISAGSAASLPPGHQRINYFAYPRYVHFLFPVWFLVGLIALRSAPRRRLTALAGVAGAVTLAAAALVSWQVARHPSYAFMAFDAPEVSLLSWDWSHLQVLLPTVATLLLLGLFAVAQLRIRTAVAALAALGVLAGAAMPTITEQAIKPMVTWQYLPDTPRLVRDVHLGPGDVVAMVEQTPWPWLYNHMREVYWHPLKLFKGADAPPTEANVVIGPLDWDGTRYGFRQIAVDSSHGWAVWRRG